MAKKVLVFGFALFAMFFGAGNILLPPFIGQMYKSSLLLSSTGFVLTAVGLPLCALLVVFKYKGDYLKLFEPMGEKFSKIILFLSFLSIGPIIAIPRTIATTYEMSVKPLYNGMNSLVFGIVFTVIIILFSIKKSEIVENIGKILTPALLISLLILIGAGILKGNKLEFDFNSYAFFNSFIEGYNTLDAIAAVIFAELIFNGVKNEKNPMMLSIKAALIAAVGLSVVYVGLIYLGAGVNVDNLGRTELITYITTEYLGNFGLIILAVIVFFACLTTAIGLVAAVSDYFEYLLNGKVKYNVIVLFVSFVSFLISQLGVDKIIHYAVPILVVFYPVLIVILILSIFKGKIINDRVILICTYTALISTVISFKVTMPLNNISMPWLIPTVIAFLLSLILKNKIKR